MLLAASFLLAISRPQVVELPTLAYYHGQFLIRDASGTQSVPVQPRTVPEKKLIAFRRDTGYAVWDKRGLTVRHGAKSRTTRLEDFPISDRFFSHDEIKSTMAKLESGDRRRGAAALSGAVRFGVNTYFLVRWANRDGTPWTEALVRISLDGKSLWPEVVGRLPGLSIAFRPLDDRLFLLQDQVAVVCRRGDAWGLITFDPKGSKLDFRPLGAALRTYMPTSPRTGVFVERTAYGTTLAGRVDLLLGVRKVVFEGREGARFLDTLRPLVVASSQSGVARLVNAETGAELRLPRKFLFERAGQYLVAWTPGPKGPGEARLYRPETWEVAASLSR